MIGRSPSKKSGNDDVNGPNGAAKEKFDFANTQNDVFFKCRRGVEC